jgi:hypothetical protein
VCCIDASRKIPEGRMRLSPSRLENEGSGAGTSLKGELKKAYKAPKSFKIKE